MRALVLLAIVGAVCVVALFRARAGLYGYIWFALMRPDYLAFAYGAYPYSEWLAIATLAGSVRHFLDLKEIVANPFARWFLILIAAFGVSVLFSVDPALAYPPYRLFLNAAILAFLIPVLIRTEAHLRTLLVVMAASLGFLGAKMGSFGLLHGGVRFASGYAGMLTDNNTMALGIVMGASICWELRPLLRRFWMRAAAAATALTGALAAAMTYSRGAALCLGVIGLLSVWRSRHRVLAVALLAAIVSGAFVLLGDSYKARLATMAAPEKEDSALSRLENYRAAMVMWKDYPLLGVGFGEENQRRLFAAYTRRDTDEPDLVVHNTYLQLLVDSGTPALLIYSGLLFGAIFWLGRSSRRQATPERKAFPRAIQTPLIAFSIGCIFLSRVMFDIPYMLLMCAASWWRIERQTGQAEEAPEDART